MTSAEARRASTAAKKAQRSRREAELGARQRALPDKRYGVILADPPWRFEPWSRETGMDRSADNHYPTSPLGAIRALGVASIAAPDSVLFLWATVPMLPQALEVLGAWGFAYKSSFVWVKDSAGTGYWSRNRGTQWSSVIAAPVGRHSEKPTAVYEVIESYFPNLPKIELHARGRLRVGREAWGNEAPDPPSSAGMRELETIGTPAGVKRDNSTAIEFQDKDDRRRLLGAICSKQAM